MIVDFQAEILRRLQLCDRTLTTYEKGKFFEDLICFLFEAIPGITTRRNKKNIFNTEEVDVLLINEFFPGGLPSPAFPPHILAECKNWSVKVDSMNVNWFDDKLESRGLGLGILIAAQGITGDPQHLTDAHFIIAKALPKGRRMLVITRKDIENLMNENDLVRLLKEKLSDLFLNMTCF
ncbi:MAG TPA: hypothetical protein VNG51_01720 [Ktedonobacteraceae bacterium]|nr:hypothetical protein [Ktedonobacteraceae bacterium]